jgi:hypothetical protein
MSMGVVRTSFQRLADNYPNRVVHDPAKYKYVDAVMATLTGTSCCIQMCQTLNLCGFTVPANSWRRDPNPSTKMDDGTRFYYMAATDELEEFLVASCGAPEDLAATVTDPSPQKRMAAIKDRTCLIVFRYSGYRHPPVPQHFEHTELWDGSKMLQSDMSPKLFSSQRVLIWDTVDMPKAIVDDLRSRGEIP